MTDSAGLSEVRAIVCAHFRERGRDDMARMITAGHGDDFPEMDVALRVAKNLSRTLERFERALAAYADEEFWGEGNCYAALAFHDQGIIARAALAGEDVLAYTAG